jgi:hypothetical protein
MEYKDGIEYATIVVTVSLDGRKLLRFRGVGVLLRRRLDFPQVLEGIVDHLLCYAGYGFCVYTFMVVSMSCSQDPRSIIVHQIAPPMRPYDVVISDIIPSTGLRDVQPRRRFSITLLRSKSTSIALRGMPSNVAVAGSCTSTTPAFSLMAVAPGCRRTPCPRE